MTFRRDFFSSFSPALPLRAVVPLCAILVATGFAKDVYQPVKQSAMEIGIGYGYSLIPGIYDSTGAYTGWGDAKLRILDSLYSFPRGYMPGSHSIPIRIKYGLGGGVDLRADWNAAFENQDLGGRKGMSRPKLGIRYTGATAGAFSNLTVPFAMGDFDNGDLVTVVEVGGILRKRLSWGRMTALLSYANNLYETDDNVRLLVQPEYVWRKGLSTYLGVSAVKTLQRELYLGVVTPGLRLDIGDAMWADASGSFTVAGRNAPAGWGASVILYRTVGR